MPRRAGTECGIAPLVGTNPSLSVVVDWNGGIRHQNSWCSTIAEVLMVSRCPFHNRKGRQLIGSPWSALRKRDQDLAALSGPPNGRKRSALALLLVAMTRTSMLYHDTGVLPTRQRKYSAVRNIIWRSCSTTTSSASIPWMPAWQASD